MTTLRAEKKFSFAFMIILLSGASICGQTRKPVETHNAALRYWIAFADLHDPPNDSATADLLEKTAAGKVAWDESKLGSILDENQDAIRGMQRATKLPECDWGLEYSLGPRASIAYAPRARVMARLNTLYGMRLVAKGNTHEAVETWLAGIRFSQHLAQGGTLIFSLIAKIGLLSNFHALSSAARTDALTQTERIQIKEAIQALPESGFDWSTAFAYEAGITEDPKSYLEALTSHSLPETNGNHFSTTAVGPPAKDLAAFQKVTVDVEDALRLRPREAQAKLEALQAKIQTLHPFYRDHTPSLLKINSARTEIETAREQLLQSLSAKQNHFEFQCEM